ncbi:DUF4214 domain-containing protein [Candidatus Poribacteria bacterium]
MSIVNRRRAAVADVDYDVEILESNDEVVEENPRNTEENDQQIKALISRMADLEHYNAINDIDFIVEAIGQKYYAGSPALDVLPSHDGIGQERRERIREYIHILNCWAEGKDVEDAAAEFKSDEKLLRNIYIHLGEPDEGKRNLILALSDNLKEKSASPEDAISQISDEEFIRYLYKTILDREPDEDDARLRLTQLKRGRTRQELINDILESRESGRRMLEKIAESISGYDNS